MAVLPAKLLGLSEEVLSTGQKLQALFSFSAVSVPGSAENLKERTHNLAECMRKERRGLTSAFSVDVAFDEFCAAFEKRLEVCQSTFPEEAPKVELQDWREKRALVAEILSQHKSWVSCENKDLVKRVEARFCRENHEKIQLVASVGFHALVQFAWRKDLLSPGSAILLLMANQTHLSQNQDFLPVKCLLKIQQLLFLQQAAIAGHRVLSLQKPLSSCSFFELISLQYIFSTVFSWASPSPHLARGVNFVTSLGVMGYAFCSGVVAPLFRWTTSQFPQNS